MLDKKTGKIRRGPCARAEVLSFSREDETRSSTKGCGKRRLGSALFGRRTGNKRLACPVRNFIKIVTSNFPIKSKVRKELRACLHKILNLRNSGFSTCEHY